MSWHDAVEFCRWLTAHEDRYYRLPTEAEWEYACRAGGETEYCSGDEVSSLAAVANLADQTLDEKFPDKFEGCKEAAWNDGFAFAAPVGSLKPNAFHLYDMAGNVSEWCSDWYARDYYASPPLNNPAGPESGDTRVSRGGYWSGGT